MFCFDLGSWCVLRVVPSYVRLRSEENLWLGYVFQCGCVQYVTMERTVVSVHECTGK